MNSLQKKIIVKALDNEDNITQDDFDFVSSLADKDEEAAKAGREYKLSKAQNKWLMDIWQKIS